MVTREKQLRIGVLTSGGDAPGMNAAIRAIVRTGINLGVKMYGIKTGYDGLFQGHVDEIDKSDVSGIIDKGGTILKTARCMEMMTEAGQQRAAEVIKVLRLDGVIIIGGDGSFKGALALSKLGVNVMCIPATIDLDMDCTDYTIGFDTAVNTADEAIGRIRDTSSSHERCSVIEVMGRNAGYLALWCGMTSGAEEVLIPENPLDTNAVIEQILRNRARGKTHNLVVVAEGIGGSYDLSVKIEQVLGIEARATVLGHFQRGGSPTALDRIHATMMGYMAVKGFCSGEINKVTVFKDGKHMLMDIEEALNAKKTYSPDMYEITKLLAI